MPSGDQENAATGPILWACAGIRPNAARIAQRNLLRQGYRAFLPLMRETRRQANRFVEVTTPVFPGYVFIALAADERWTPINSTLGITRLVSFRHDGCPALLPAGFMGDLLDRCDDDGRVAALPELTVASPAKLACGPLQGIIGKVTRLKSRERVELLMTLFQREVTVTTVKQNIARATTIAKDSSTNFTVPY